jgi:gamma-butyrobetaine dioxygenase
MDVQITESSLKIIKNKKLEYELPFLWLRDNCPCNYCRVKETQEKRFMLSSIPVDLKPKIVNVNEDAINIFWPDDHETSINFKDIEFLTQPRKPKKILWADTFIPNYYDWSELLQNNDVAIEAFSDFISTGAICIKNSPCTPNSLEKLTPKLGPIREVLFERIHNVSVDGHVYNIAHTSLEVPPHNDFASYSWPPSVQALHMLENECSGGESMIVDGYKVLSDLREDCPDFFDVLRTFTVPFREFDEENETYANEPIIRLNSLNEVIGLRYSNQLMQMIDPRKQNIDLFYKAYHELCKRVNDKKYKSIFRLDAGNILLVSSHRVLHGRKKFKPDGKRHLQDAYYELDNIENNLFLYKNLRGN